MLRALMICPDPDISENLQKLVEESQHLGLVRVIDRYPVGVELARFLRAQAPHVVLLSIDNIGKAVEIIEGIDAAAPGVQVVAISKVNDPQILLELMRKGVREFLTAPFRREDLFETVGRLRENAEKRPPSYFSSDLLFTFLPSKPGVGTSTIAMNATYAASKVPETKSLLVDWDLNNGLQRFMLKLHSEYSITDAAENAFNLDENMWPQLVSAIGNMDVLHAGKLNPHFRIEPTQVRHLVDFTRRIYRVISVDLSGNMEKYSLELMQESKKVFVVCTPEIASLHLAREKISFLKTLDLADRVAVLLNRSQKRAVISSTQIQDLLGVPVTMSLPNDYQGVHRALQAGKPVDENSDLGKSFSKLAFIMLERKLTQSTENKRRLADIFSFASAKPAAMEAKKPAAS
jgi:pilus assembly protein CpaE